MAEGMRSGRFDCACDSGLVTGHPFQNNSTLPKRAIPGVRLYVRDAVGERLSTMSVGKSHEGVRYRTVSKLEPRSNH
jgi:hypothetical protein